MTALERRWAAAFLCIAAVLGGGQAVAGDSRDPRFDASAALAVSQAAVGRPLREYVFTNDLNRKIELGELRGKPLVISLVYTSCADICPVVSESLADAVDAAGDLFGKDTFNVITVGFDARNDTPQRMRAYDRSHGLERPNWRFLSADFGTIDRLANELGFLFYASPRGFDHLSQTTIVDPEGRVYGHIYGASFNPPQLVEPLKDLVFGRDRSSGGWVGLVGQVRLFCTFYDPASGRYRFDYSVFLTAILGGLSLAGVAVILVRAMLQRRRLAKEDPPVAERPRVMRTGLRYGFQWVEGWLDRVFGPRWNPLYALGALGFFYYWVGGPAGIRGSPACRRSGCSSAPALPVTGWSGTGSPNTSPRRPPNGWTGCRSSARLPPATSWRRAIWTTGSSRLWCSSTSRCHWSCCSWCGSTSIG